MSSPSLTAVAMSGGVDSSVAAALVAREGRAVVGFSMKLVDRLAGVERRFARCCSPEDYGDARRVAEILGFPHYVLDMEDDFRRHVLAPFADDYASGRTPSPCVRCNTFLKFGALLDRGRAVGADGVAGVSEKATFRRDDIFRTNFSNADVLTLFLLPELNERLWPTIVRMRPGTRIVSNSFEMGDWEPDQVAEVEDDCQTYCKALLWIVPARVEGRWRMGRDTIALKQKFQTFTGTIRRGKAITPITNGRLNGNEITFTAGGTEYIGMVNGRVIQGSTKSGGKWQARRA